ncbi:hypothetical protein P691DRAFT_758919 [Macrolepiota fuliginosa MF-IS2]|uniref:Uncharacterized protein n=1 Tax=Macrolepiota fuliginosa MF-IS2 TaxID=1400762 RepID=A0A9P6C5W7_9AGAR|nr:hypothetical protein P691DRAFT_758919 [Macrolepiota fuliginosa MF-IS2]
MHKTIQQDFALSYFPQSECSGSLEEDRIVPCCSVIKSRIAQDVPFAPSKHPVPLPPQTEGREKDLCRQNEENLYPLNLRTIVPLSRQLELWSISIVFPVHIHTPFSHIGIIRSSIPITEISAFELFVYLRSLVAEHPPAPDAGVVESTATQNDIVCAQILLEPAGTTSSVQQSLPRDATECHLTFDSDDVWGFEVRRESGYSVIHVASAGDSI